MNRKAIAAVFGVVLLGGNCYAADSCATIVCLGGSMKPLNGQGGLMCKQPIQDYFDIKKRKHGHFDPGATYVARQRYLDQCKEGSDIEKTRIQSAFGTVPDNPGFN
jgi:hypothetical protein